MAKLLILKGKILVTGAASPSRFLSHKNFITIKSFIIILLQKIRQPKKLTLLLRLGMYDLEQQKRRKFKPGNVKSTPVPEDAVAWVQRTLDFSPDAQQQAVLSTDIRRGILNCTRQWGKSTIAAAKAVHHAVHEAGTLTVAVSPCLRQSGELVRKAEGFVRKLGIKVKGDGTNEISIELPNGSRIIGLPGNEATNRGYSAVSLLLVDEAARVSDDLYKSIRPMLAVTDGALWLMSTPCGKRGFFYDEWSNGGPEWRRFRIPAPECSRISPRFLEQERVAMGDRHFRQEYLCEFVETNSGVFDRDLVELAMSSEFEPLRID